MLVVMEGAATIAYMHQLSHQASYTTLESSLKGERAPTWSGGFDPFLIARTSFRDSNPTDSSVF